MGGGGSIRRRALSVDGQPSAVSSSVTHHPLPPPLPPSAYEPHISRFAQYGLAQLLRAAMTSNDAPTPDPQPHSPAPAICTWPATWAACRGRAEEGAAAFIPRTPRATLGAPACAIAIAIAIGGLMTLDERIKKGKTPAGPLTSPPACTPHLAKPCF